MFVCEHHGRAPRNMSRGILTTYMTCHVLPHGTRTVQTTYVVLESQAVPM